MAHDREFQPIVGSDRDRSEIESRAATSSLVWGILAMFVWLLPPVGVLVVVASLVRGAQKWERPHRDRARLGVFLSVTSLLFNAWLVA